MKNELQTLFKALGTGLRSLILIVRYVIGYPLLAIAITILPVPRKQLKKSIKRSQTSEQSTRLSRYKLDYIMQSPKSSNSKGKDK